MLTGGGASQIAVPRNLAEPSTRVTTLRRGELSRVLIPREEERNGEEDDGGHVPGFPLVDHRVDVGG